MFNICSFIHKSCFLEAWVNSKECSKWVFSKSSFSVIYGFQDKDLDKKTMSFITT